MSAHSSDRYQELWRALHSVSDLTHDVVVRPVLLDAESRSPDAGFQVTFDDPGSRRHATYIIEASAAEVQVHDRDSGVTEFHPIDLDLTDGYRVLGEERGSALRAAAELLRDAVERTRAEPEK